MQNRSGKKIGDGSQGAFNFDLALFSQVGKSCIAAKRIRKSPRFSRASQSDHSSTATIKYLFSNKDISESSIVINEADFLGNGSIFEINGNCHGKNSAKVMRNIILLFCPDKNGPVVDKAKHPALNFKLSNYILRSKVRGLAQSELIFLSCRMDEDGYGLLGDIVQMSRQQVLLYAQSDDRIKNPQKTVNRLEGLLLALDFSFGMQALEWLRSPRPCFAERIARRNLQMEAMGPQRPRSTHLRLVSPDL